VVLMGGCDKTVPAQLMGAVSADRPAIALLAGPMMTGRHGGERHDYCMAGFEEVIAAAREGSP